MFVTLPINQGKYRSYWQEKSDFSNSLIFSLVTTDQPKPELPDYILKGLEWLTLMLKRDGVSYEL